MNTEPTSPEAGSGLRHNLRSIEAAAVAGIVYAGLAVWAMSLFSSVPDLSLSDDQLTEWFSNGNLILGLNLAAISSIAFLWFVAVVRRRIGDQEDRFFSTVFVGSATLYLAVWLTGAAILTAPAIALAIQDDLRVTQDTATLAAGSAAALILVVAPRLQAVFVISTSTLLLRTRTMPKWLSFLGYLIGVCLFVIPTIFQFLGIGLPVWVLIASITILVLRRQPQSEPSESRP